jgi:hypothetical protein
VPETITATMTLGPFVRIRRDGTLNHLVEWRVAAFARKAVEQGYAVCVLRDERSVRVLATRTDPVRAIVTTRATVRAPA